MTSQNYNDFEDCYVHTQDSPQYWLVRDGERVPVASPAEMHAYGLKPVVVVTEKQLEAVPIKGAKRKAAKKTEADE